MYSQSCHIMTGKYRYHVRSTSLPSTSHPLTAMVEEQLSRMREWETMSSHCTAEMLLQGFCDLQDLYERVEDLLQLPNTQLVLMNYQSEKWVNETLEGSVQLLDVSGTTRDVLVHMKQNVQGIRSVIRRRRGGEIDIGSEIVLYMASRKKMNRVIRKCLGELKGIGSRKRLPTIKHSHGHELVAVVNVLRNVEAITVCICESLLQFMSGTRSVPEKLRGWSLVSKLKREIVEEMNEVKTVDVALNVLLDEHCSHENQVVRNAQKGLEILEASIEGFEEGLEWVFKQLIKTRVSLLNILNN